MNEKQKPRFVTYEAENSDYEFHDTLGEALKYLNDADYSEGFSTEAMEGENFIAEITHRSKFTETENREAYHVHTEECEKNNCQLEEWPYGNWDFVGDLTYEPVEREPEPESLMKSRELYRYYEARGNTCVIVDTYIRELEARVKQLEGK
jgi:hypothetical protein